MKRFKLLGLLLVMCTFAGIFMSADHIDAPDVSGTNADITDFYAFQGENPDNLVFVTNLKGLLSPDATAMETFDENTLLEINVDNDGDFVEDLVIQAIPRDGKMYVFGPVAPSSVGKTSTIMSNAKQASVEITSYSQSAKKASSGGVTVFAGPRDDPFFMDFAQYGAIIGGMASGFNNPGSDTFAGTNVMSIVIEVEKSQLGSSETINTWVETKTK